MEDGALAAVSKAERRDERGLTYSFADLPAPGPAAPPPLPGRPPPGPPGPPPGPPPVPLREAERLVPYSNSLEPPVPPSLPRKQQTSLCSLGERRFHHQKGSMKLMMAFQLTLEEILIAVEDRMKRVHRSDLAIDTSRGTSGLTGDATLTESNPST